MSATAKSGTGAPARMATSWAPAALACMGVVFGDIGTSPLYTLNVAAKAASPSGQVSPDAVLGIVSLIFWSLIIVVSIKYAILIMRADNHGEGGILALLALVSPRRAKQNKRRASFSLNDEQYGEDNHRQGNDGAIHLRGVDLDTFDGA